MAAMESKWWTQTASDWRTMVATRAESLEERLNRLPLATIADVEKRRAGSAQGRKGLH